MRKIYSLFLACALLLTAQFSSAQNIALGKTAVSSTNENGLLTPDLAVDGNGTGAQLDGNGNCTSGSCTRWASDYNDANYIYIDLTAVYDISSVTLNWETARGLDFSIDVSNDAITWMTITTITGNTSYINNITLTGATGRYIRMQGITRATVFGYSLWEFEVFGTLSTLPVTLSSFSAAKNGNTVDLKWGASTDNTSEFIIERSSNGIAYTSIGTVNVPGRTVGYQNFDFKDASPLKGRSFYRLHYSETGSAKHYSPVVTVNFTSKNEIIVYPNPVKGNMINIELSAPVSGNLEIKLTNAFGAVIYKRSLQANNQREFHVEREAKIAAGNYFLEITNNETTITRQISFL